MANMNDDKDLMMLDDFFKEATELEIDDNGFTDKVMEVLPSTECKKAENRRLCQGRAKMEHHMRYIGGGAVCGT